MPAPQYYNPTADRYEVLKGQDGASNVRIPGSNQVGHGVVTVATANTESTLPNVPCREIMVIALDTNTGPIYLGGPGTSATSYGVKLKPDASVVLPVSNANLISIVASADGEGVSYVTV